MAKRKIRRNKGKQTRKVNEYEIDRKSLQIGDPCIYCNHQGEPHFVFNESAGNFTVRCKKCNGYQKIVSYGAVLDYEAGLTT